MRAWLLICALTAAVPLSVRADELSDVKAQLDAALKSIQALQQRVETLEAQKSPAASAATSAAPAPSSAEVPASTPAPAAAAPVVAADGIGPITGRHYPSALIKGSPWGFQPRVGVAWRPIPTSSVILRAGYGIYRNTSVFQTLAQQMAQQPPLSFAFNAVSTPETPGTVVSSIEVVAKNFAVVSGVATHTSEADVSSPCSGCSRGS